MSDKFTLDANRDYWEREDTISIIDRNLHQLEMDFVSGFLEPHHMVADIGSGNGEATLAYARKVKHCTGIERSERLRGLARESLEHSGLDNAEFVEGDVLALGREAEFDVVVTQRMLINLPSWEHQKKAIENIGRALKPGGTYVMIENTWDGQDAMNRYREAAGQKSIPLHWHNEYLDYDQLAEFMDSEFDLIRREGFNLYYFLTRVYVQMFARFEGFGATAQKDQIFDQADRAAREMHNLFGDEISFKDAPVFGPIQGIAFRKR